MKRQLTLTQLKAALKIKIAKVQESVTAFTGATNPQVRDMFLASKGELDGLTLVLEAIEQGTTYFIEH